MIEFCDDIDLWTSIPYEFKILAKYQKIYFIQFS